MKTVSPIVFILLLAMQPTNRVIWLLLLFAAGICTYIFTIAEKEKALSVVAILTRLRG